MGRQRRRKQRSALACQGLHRFLASIRKRRNDGFGALENTFVQTIARYSLTDDGRRSLDEELEGCLHNDYPGWQHPQGTTMVPSIFPCNRFADRGIEAEKTFFNLLEELGNQSQEPMFAVHSYEFSELVNDVPTQGEHDFVVVHHRIGPIFFQVKAKDSIGTEYEVYEGAAKQVTKDREVTVSHLERVFGQGAADAVSLCAGFVVMPNCPRPQDPEQTGLFKEDCRDILTFSKWWKANVNVYATPTGFPQEMFEHLIKRFVGHLHTKLCPSIQSFAATCRKLDVLTREQLKTWLGASARQWITGPAGTGKTWLLQEKIVELALDTTSAKILVLCYSKLLSLYLQKQFNLRLKQADNIKVMTYDKFLLDHLGMLLADHKNSEKHRLIAAACAKFQQQVETPIYIYDHIFIDEGQGLYGRWAELLEFFLDKKPLAAQTFKPHYFWVMYDPNQHDKPSADHYISYQQQLIDSIKLTQVLRSTGKIFELSKKYYSAPVGLSQEPKLGHKVAGHPVFWDNSLPDEVTSKAEAGSGLVAKYVRELNSEYNNVQLNDICVLTKSKSTRDNLTHELKQAIPCQNAEVYIQTGETAVIVESISKFKGLEAKVVILFDPVDAETPLQWVHDLLYTALSRCFCYLIIVSTKTCCEIIKNFTLEHAWKDCRTSK